MMAVLSEGCKITRPGGHVGAGAGAPWRALAVAMSFMNQVAALREFFKPPLDAPLPLQVAMMNEAMGIVCEGALPKQCPSRSTRSAKR